MRQPLQPSHSGNVSADPDAGHRRSFSDRLLVEVVCQREEAAGHPAKSDAADSVAIEAGGGLIDRVYARARSLPDAPMLDAAIRRIRVVGSALVFTLAVVVFVIGCASASLILAATVPANLPLILIALVGFNVLWLLLWILAQLFSQRIVGLGGWLFTSLQWLLAHPAWQRIADFVASFRGRRTGFVAASESAGHPDLEVLRVIVSGGRGRWLFGSISNTLWLVYALANALALVLLLGFRSYELSWQTTLFSTEALSGWARVLSLGPATLGLVSGDSLAVTDTASELARQAWSRWLVWTTVVYGALPRAIAWCTCLALLWRASATIGSDQSRPGFARLRARLMPDSRRLPPVGPPPPTAPEPTPSEKAVPAPTGSVHGLAIDGASDIAPSLPGVEWIWLGPVDDSSSREAALQRLRHDKVAALAIVVRAKGTPSQGIERLVAELTTAARAPSVLVLQNMDRLEARGEDALRTRVCDWQALARRAGSSGVLSGRGESVSLGANSAVESQ